MLRGEDDREVLSGRTVRALWAEVSVQGGGGSREQDTLKLDLKGQPGCGREKKQRKKEMPGRGNSLCGGTEAVGMYPGNRTLFHVALAESSGWGAT